MRRPTIIDVASRAGVSKSTVSLVLQESPLVRPETRETVRQAMAEIGYVYNRSAAQLRSSNTGLIGLVINDLRNPFFTEFATSVQMALSARGYATVVANTDESPQQGGFSNDDANIRQQQAEDIADPNQQPPLPDPGGERHAAIAFDDEDVGDEGAEIASR